MTVTSTPHDVHAQLAGGGSMPLIGFGTWQLRGDEARRSVGWALEAGYRHLDTATAYDNETEVGAAVHASGLQRDQVFLTTKLPPDHGGRERETLERSLTALDTDHVDLWLIHWPPTGSSGPAMWRELVRARADGLARAVGVSNHSLDQIDELARTSDAAPEVNQIKWSPFLFDREEYDGHRERGVVLEGYSPFRAGRLDDPVLAGIAEAHGASAAQVIVRWHLQHGIVVIPKSARRERIVDNVDVGVFELAGDEMAALDALGSPASG